jgi:transcriptional regulator with XRE-family HTH domain
VAAGLSITELAVKAECSVAYLSQLERGQYSASARILGALANALDCEIADLMPREPNGAAA